MLGSLGIVFGDIGTSPLYAMSVMFNSSIGFTVNETTVLGVLSLITWSLIIVISIKYVGVMMRSDNQGEGGIFALFSNIPKSFRRKNYMVVIVIFGASLLIGDAVITPAISVMSAVQGVELALKGPESLVMPLTILIISMLLWLQHIGVHKISKLFGPIMLIWFISIAFLGLFALASSTEILKAINPIYIVKLINYNPIKTFILLGGIVLVITGGEALYANMGQFKRETIKNTWFFCVLPALLLNYFGQGAKLLSAPESTINPFWSIVPSQLHYFMLIIATLAAIIASQAVISGVFSLIRQSISWRMLPRINQRYTSINHARFVYFPLINFILWLLIVWVVLLFKTPSGLAEAYGIAVTSLMVVTTILLLCQLINNPNRKWSKILLVFALLIVDGIFFSANSLKIGSGGQIPIFISTFMAVIMITFYFILRYLKSLSTERSEPIEKINDWLTDKQLARPEVTAIYTEMNIAGLPASLDFQRRLYKTLAKRIILLSIEFSPQPFVNAKERLKLTEIHPECFKIEALYGYMDVISVQNLLPDLKDLGLTVKLDSTVFFTRRTLIDTQGKYPAPHIFKIIFRFLWVNSMNDDDYLQLPKDKTIGIALKASI